MTLLMTNVMDSHVDVARPVLTGSHQVACLCGCEKVIEDCQFAGIPGLNLCSARQMIEAPCWRTRSFQTCMLMTDSTDT